MPAKPDPAAARQSLRDGELTILGRIRSASNATFLCEAAWGELRTHCVYKPIAGEQPLWDFPDGTLAGRELGAYLVSAALGWDIVPYTIIRDGPAGRGMVQLWVDQPGAVLGEAAPEDAEQSPDTGPELVDVLPRGRVPRGYLPVLQAYDYAGDEVTLVHADDARLRRVAVFDVLVNNADRKGGHILAGVDGRVYGIDHGVSLHAEDKLRTVLWGWAGATVEPATLARVVCLAEDLGGALGGELARHITEGEVAALSGRVRGLIEHPVMPAPGRRRPIPQPVF